MAAVVDDFVELTIPSYVAPKVQTINLELRRWLAETQKVESPEALRVHEETDFKVSSAGVTKPGEFEYTHGGRVTAGLEYHIHYTYDKEEVYMTNGAHTNGSRIIKKIDGIKTMLSQYLNIKSSIRDDYPKKVLANPTEADYRIGNITRYFTQKVNNIEDDLFEISEEDFNNQNNLFRYIEIDWRISGKKSEVTRDNTRTINFSSRTLGNKQLRKMLYALQFWKPDKNSFEDTQRKLGRLKLVSPSPVFTYGPPPPFPAYNPTNRLEISDDEDIARSGNPNNPTNIVYDEFGNPVIGFVNGTRVDLTESGP